MRCAILLCDRVSVSAGSVRRSKSRNASADHAEKLLARARAARDQHDAAPRGARELEVDLHVADARSSRSGRRPGAGHQPRAASAGSGLAGVAASGPADRVEARRPRPWPPGSSARTARGLFEATAIAMAPRAERRRATSATPGSRCDFSTATCGYRSRKSRTPSAARSAPTASSRRLSRPWPTIARTAASGSGAAPSAPHRVARARRRSRRSRRSACRRGRRRRTAGRSSRLPATPLAVPVLPRSSPASAQRPSRRSRPSRRRRASAPSPGTGPSEIRATRLDDVGPRDPRPHDLDLRDRQRLVALRRGRGRSPRTRGEGPARAVSSSPKRRTVVRRGVTKAPAAAPAAACRCESLPATSSSASLVVCLIVPTVRPRAFSRGTTSTMIEVFPESWPPTNATTAGLRSG